MHIKIVEEKTFRIFGETEKEATENAKNFISAIVNIFVWCSGVRLTFDSDLGRIVYYYELKVK